MTRLIPTVNTEEEERKDSFKSSLVEETAAIMMTAVLWIFYTAVLYESSLVVKGIDVDLPLCAAWKTSGVTVAGREDGICGDALDQLAEPGGLYATRDGTLYVVDRGNHRVMKYTSGGGRNGVQIGDGRGSGPRQLDAPNAVAVDEVTNAVYISDYGNKRIQMWSEGGIGSEVETVLEPLTTNNFFPAEDIQLDPRSNDILYILESWSFRVSRWKLRAKYTDSSFKVFWGTSGFHVDAQQTVYFPVPYLNEVFQWANGRRVSVTGERDSQWNPLNNPSAVVVDSGGGVFIADSENHRIILWELNAPTGICVLGCSATRGNKSDQLAKSKDVTFDSKGNLLVADTENHRVQRFDLFINARCGKYRALLTAVFTH